MKILTICSSPYVSLKPVTELLEGAGLPRGENSVAKNQSYEQWHKQVFEAYEYDCSGMLVSNPLKPGKVWQDMASQLIQDNLSKTQWYWSDSKAGWLLDFWHLLEPQQRFALIYSPPQFGISQCLLHVDEQMADIEIIVKNWINYHFELLRFYRRHQDKCVLVNLQRCIEQPAEFIRVCQQHLGLEIEEQLSVDNLQSLNQLSGIENVLFDLIVKKYPEINGLYQEMEASATPFMMQVGSQSVIQVSGKEQLANICSDYRNLKIQQADDAEASAQLQRELGIQLLKSQELESDNQQKIVSLQALIKKSEYEKVVLEIQKSQEVNALKVMIKDMEEAKEVLVKQKTREIEVLQHTIREAEDVRKAFEAQTTQEIETLQVTLKDVEETRQAIEKQKEQENQALQRTLKSFEEAKESLEKQVQTLQDEVKQKSIEYEQENDLMLLQLHQAQEELEAQFLQAKKIDGDKIQELGILQDQVKQAEASKAELSKQQAQEQQALQAKLKQAEASKAELSKQQTQEKQALEAKQKQAEALQTEVKQYEQKSIEHEQENERMLLQLHQVQEELEHYFKKHQALEADIQSHGAIAFIEQRQDTRLAINAQLIQVTQEAEGLRVDLINLQWKEQTWPKYHLQIIKPSFIYGQNTATAAIKLPLQEGNLLPLKAWPPQTADEQGPYWMIDESLLRIEQEHSHLDAEDIGFLHALICQLPDWLKLTKSVNVNNSWEGYYLAIDSLKPNLDVVFNLHDGY